MRILIPAMEDNPPAAKALQAEGLEPEVRLMSSKRKYSETMHEFWNDHTGFIVVEHDIIPWPGALNKMWNCNRPWCGHTYPLHARGLFGGYLGCTKFSKEITERFPKLPLILWREPWMNVDGAFLTEIRKHTGLFNFHFHFPPVAHIRELPEQNNVNDAVKKCVLPPSIPQSEPVHRTNQTIKGRELK